ncbi:transcriptional regulator, HxlR family [Frankia casuarinae]|uniref:Transcriptional regulator n=1 Tax=Frankia casuarinae (strain DSM 45818 / CECT 9043 / HFP020203 / CcI3) TaxID=106370 RepID=Q2JC87_FRACC|nr:putative transcriptional regulator [Frankia casuarinae]EYT90875.1 transcriptional regulator, HxlR family [Frankia casuarinae]
MTGIDDLSGPDQRILLHDLRRTLNPGWLPDVLVALSSGPQPYTGLLRTLRSYDVPRGRRWPQPLIQEAVLTRTLRWMQRRGLVERARERAFPFGTVYWLTPAAKELADLVTPMAQWAAAHEDLLEIDRRAWAERRRRAKSGGNRRPRSG